MGGGGPAETCRAKPPRRRDTACPVLPSREEAKGLILALPADLVLPLRSCGGPDLRLWAIAPMRPLLMGMATGKTCTLGSKAITDEKKEKWKPHLHHLNLQGFTYAPKEKKRTDTQFSYHCLCY